MKKSTFLKMISVPFLVAAGWIASDALLLQKEEKAVYKGFTQMSFEDEKPSVFTDESLERIVRGEDIVPGLPEEGAMCSKFVRATANTLLGHWFFQHHRLHAKIKANAFGITTLPADEYGLSGDAWEMYGNIQNKGGKLMYETEHPVQDNLISANYLVSHAKIGDIIGFYYPDSKYNPQAKKQGAGFTHMGIVVGFDEVKEPIIAHFMHTNYYFENEPVLRYETLSAMQEKLSFQGYQKELDFVKGEEEYKYQKGDSLVFVKAILRPRYNL
ncbi:hypothetical protein HYX13_00595 [Candidatus Woesearchaeota archaeon]|nr:hypothetical protein [Candidatus Woesearchaeota archaeon]